jgi:hypothetical protein
MPAERLAGRSRVSAYNDGDFHPPRRQVPRVKSYASGSVEYWLDAAQNADLEPELQPAERRDREHLMTGDRHHHHASISSGLGTLPQRPCRTRQSWWTAPSTTVGREDGRCATGRPAFVRFGGEPRTGRCGPRVAILARRERRVVLPACRRGP